MLPLSCTDFLCFASRSSEVRVCARYLAGKGQNNSLSRVAQHCTKSATFDVSRKDIEKLLHMLEGTTVKSIFTLLFQVTILY